MDNGQPLPSEPGRFDSDYLHRFSRLPITPRGKTREASKEVRDVASRPVVSLSSPPRRECDIVQDELE